MIKEELVSLVSVHGTSSGIVVKKSQELDELILEVMRMNKKNENGEAESTLNLY